jgi:peptidoglycan/LPS O-acetylase OafA/YrhL
MIAEMLFPERRAEPWLSKAQITLCAVVLAAWAPVLTLLARADEPLFVPSSYLWLITAAVIVALVIASRFGRPHTAVRESVSAPHPCRFFAIGLLSTTVVLGTVLILPESGRHPPLVVTIPLLVAFDAASLLLILRWSGRGRAWDDRHRLALVAGWLTFFIVVNALGDIEEFQGKIIVSAATVVALVALRRLANQRQRTATSRREA